MNANVEKIKEELKLNKTQKLLLGGAIVVATGLGFKFGRGYERAVLNVALEMCFTKDPTLREHFTTVVKTVNNIE